jgi:hypothetical protein
LKRDRGQGKHVYSPNHNRSASALVLLCVHVEDEIEWLLQSRLARERPTKRESVCPHEVKLSMQTYA